jgi:hypothetical protein
VKVRLVGQQLAIGESRSLDVFVRSERARIFVCSLRLQAHKLSVDIWHFHKSTIQRVNLNLNKYDYAVGSLKPSRVPILNWLA